MGFIGIRLILTRSLWRSEASRPASSMESFFPETSVYSMVMRRRGGSG
jgi:hypothetical protein